MAGPGQFMGPPLLAGDSEPPSSHKIGLNKQKRWRQQDCYEILTKLSLLLELVAQAETEAGLEVWQPLLNHRSTINLSQFFSNNYLCLTAAAKSEDASNGQRSWTG